MTILDDNTYHGAITIFKKLHGISKEMNKLISGIKLKTQNATHTPTNTCFDKEGMQWKNRKHLQHMVLV